jgi:hypothetical protein
MVGQQTLTLLIGVRVPVSQPIPSCAALAAYNVPMKVSRRKLLQVLPAAAIPLASEAVAQTPSASDVELEGARQYLKVGAQVVRQVQLPMTTEPATRFVPRS